MEKEIFVFVKGFEGLYLISNKGTLLSFPRWDNKKKYVGGCLVKKLIDAYGYECAVLYNNGIGKNVKIHRLVAESFIDNPYDKQCVDHVNGIRNDNRVENLRWCTISENNNFENAHNTRVIKSIEAKENGSKSIFARSVVQMDINGVEIDTFSSISQASYKTGLSSSHISSACSGKRKSCGGFLWKYNGEPLKKMPLCKKNSNKAIPLIQYDMSGILIAEYSSAHEAGKILGIKPSSISRVLNGHRKSVHNFIFKYKKNVLE